jgi:hypothetical protein
MGVPIIQLLYDSSCGPALAPIVMRVQQSAKFELVVDIKTAKALGLIFSIISRPVIE